VIVAVTGNTWLEVIVTLSIVVPVAVVVALALVFLRSARNDPDEQRWRRLDEQRRLASRSDPNGDG
jgi:heme/copper-type cytochrome/quinol oxidase subunit 2